MESGGTKTKEGGEKGRTRNQALFLRKVDSILPTPRNTNFPLGIISVKNIIQASYVAAYHSFLVLSHRRKFCSEFMIC